MAAENEGAQTNTEAPGDSKQSVDTSGQGGDKTLLGTEGKTEGEQGKTDDTKQAGTEKTGQGDKDASKDGAGKDGEDKSGQKAADKDDAKAPVEYGEFKLPDGMSLDKAALGHFTPIAKDLGLNQDQAQKLVDTYAAMQLESAKAFADQVAQWGEATRKDAEIGGAKFDENLKTAITGLNAFGSPELVDLLNSTGLGNHPEVIRFCRRVGMALQEDKVVAPGAGAGRQISASQVLFDHPTSQQKGK